MPSTQPPTASVLAVTVIPRGSTATLSGEVYFVPEAPHRAIAPAARSGRVRGQNPRSDPRYTSYARSTSSDRCECDLVSHVVLAAQQRHALDLGLAAPRPGHLVVALTPLRWVRAPRPHAAPVPLGERLRHLGGGGPVLPAHVQRVAPGAQQDGRDLGVRGDPAQRPARDRSGKRAALPPPPPLRTGRVNFPTSGSSLHFRPGSGGRGARRQTSGGAVRCCLSWNACWSRRARRAR